ncbi:carbon-nitrogen hydrolase family protein [Paracoccus aestuariivivens]|uniref:Carbon-nitrogen hydrolase family protein n=1 Tax=Paracoccus aestuariivivens TaxID=1820333 RepID=A0A6L6JH74_9RHOB|nr:carbon-nitrogen hydrolase family protein [Paracoccus aestuariivivens]MTH79231.1 carbon-nitrogen hydrolase family protein [Paracoccus aestuariivivens]
MKISFAQFSPIHGDTAATIALVAEKSREAAGLGARLIAFPECFLTGGSFDDRASLLAAAVDIERGDLEPVIAAARDGNIHIVVGFYHKRGDEALNTAALIGPQGIIGLHHKMHLPFMIGDRFVDIPQIEGPSVFDTEIGRIGLAICYEIRFPEVARTLALEGAELIVLPAAWPEAARILPDLFSRVRAAENFVYFLSANRNDVDDGMGFMGSSHVIGPDGREIINAGMDDGIFMVDVDLEQARVKSIIRDPGVYEVHPFADRRPQDYRICASQVCA